MKILVTGGAGFIGSHVAEMFLQRHHKVLVVDNFSTGKSENLFEYCKNGGQLVDDDILDFARMAQIFSGYKPDVVIHLAAQSAITSSLQDPQLDLRINGIGTLNIIMLARAHGTKKIVFSSTSAVYKESWKRLCEMDRCEPTTPYGISKLASEQYLKGLFPSSCILRYGNVYGPRQVPVGQNQVIAKVFSHFHNGDKFYVNGDGKQKRDFVYVADVAWANYMAATEDVVGTFNICSGRSYSVNDILKMISVIYDVPQYAWQHNDHQDSRGDVRMNSWRSFHNLGWKSGVDIRFGLFMTSEWWKKNA